MGGWLVLSRHCLMLGFWLACLSRALGAFSGMKSISLWLDSGWEVVICSTVCLACLLKVTMELANASPGQCPSMEFRLLKPHLSL